MTGRKSARAHKTRLLRQIGEDLKAVAHAITPLCQDNPLETPALIISGAADTYASGENYLPLSEMFMESRELKHPSGTPTPKVH